MKEKIFIAGIIVLTLVLLGVTLINNNKEKSYTDFNSYVLNTIKLADDGGSYYTGRTNSSY